MNTSEPDLCWDNLGASNRSCLILHYVGDLADRMNLSEHEARQLHQVVAVGFNQRYFNGHQVVLVNRRIDILNGLLWDHDRRRFRISAELRPSSSRANPKKAATDFNPFLNRWQRYIEYMDRVVMGSPDPEPATTEVTEEE